MTDRAIICPSFGPQSFQKAVLTPGDRLLIGESESAGFRIPCDPHLGNAQAELSWNGSVGKVRAVGPSQTVLVNGQSTSEGLFGHLTWFRVGGTTFLCCRERHTPPRTVPKPQPGPQHGPVIETLRGIGSRLYAVLDAARDDRILELLRESPNETRSLYEGTKGDAMAEGAPYLVRLEPEDWLLETLIIEGWGQNWGIFLECSLSFKEVRRHFRHFLRVQQEGSQEYLYFRFYDPRVLRIFLPTCSDEQLDQFYGPIQKFCFEDASGEFLQAVHHSKQRSNDPARTDEVDETSDL